MQRILITGGAGFIGANLIRALLDQGRFVTILDNMSVGRREYFEHLPCELVSGDILDVDLMRRLAQEHEAVIHLAAQTGVPGSILDPRQDCVTNVLGTLNVLEGCRSAWQDRAGPRKFVFASSNAPLGRQLPPAREDKAPLPISPYGASKLAGEAYSLAYFGSWGLPTVALRFGNVYGPFSAHKNSVVAKFCKDALGGRDLIVDGDGGQTRDFIFVGDLVEAIVKALLNGSVRGEVFQIATGIETSITELAERIQSLFGREVSIQHGPTRRGDAQRNYSAIGKAAALLDWTPRTDLEQGLRLTVDWFRERLPGKADAVALPA